MENSKGESHNNYNSGQSKRSTIIRSFKAQADARRTKAEIFADWLTGFFGTVTFLIINAIWFSVWILHNIGMIPILEPFDPFPFGLLTMVVSLEAIFLAIIVLISQNREAKIADLREEIDLQINVIAEEEVTYIVKMLNAIMKKQGITPIQDNELKEKANIKDHKNLEELIEDELT